MRAILVVSTLTNATVKSKKVEGVEAIQSNFWRNQIYSGPGLDKSDIMENLQTEFDKTKPLFNNNQLSDKVNPYLIGNGYYFKIKFVLQMVSGQSK